MKEIKIEYIDKPFEENLRSILEGRIFHVTSYENYKSMILDGIIANNSGERFNPNPRSTGCFSIVKGYVSLFDLRERSKEIIDQTLSKYYFLAPPWFCVNKSSKDTLDIVFLILNKKYSSHLIPNSAAEKYRVSNNLAYIQYIPHTECWFPGDLPVRYLSQAIHVIITRPDHIASMCSNMSESASEDHLDRLIKQTHAEFRGHLA